MSIHVHVLELNELWCLKIFPYLILNMHVQRILVIKNLGNKETNFLPSCFSLQDWWFYCTCTFFQDSVLHWHTTWTFTDLEIVLIKFSCVWYTIKKFDLTSCWIKSLGVKSICQSVCIDTRIFLTSITNVRSALALKKNY